MFVLSVIKDTVPLVPHTFLTPAPEALTRELNKKYANRVLLDVGLSICVFDLLEVSDGKVRFGDGCLWYKVTFRLVVFRPFPAEVLIGKVKSSTEDGIRLSIGFFDDLHIPLAYLPSPSAFDPNERAFFWLPGSDAMSSLELLDSPKADRLYVDAGEPIRFRVEADEFYDDEPGPPKAVEGIQPRENRRPPYSITCSIAEQGLGLLAWWSGDATEATTMQEE